MKKNTAFQEYKNKLEEKKQEELNEKFKDAPPAKMSREVRRQYSKHYRKLGVPKEEIDRILLMHSFDFKENNGGINIAEISQKVSSGELPKNTLQIIQSHAESE